MQVGRTKQRRTAFYPRRLSLAVALAFAPAGAALALPTGEQVIAGQATVNRPTGTTLTVQQTTPSAIINWQGFSIGAPESVLFQQPGSGSVALNRVVGNQPSQIFGRLQSNGQLFLVNPNGVLFGRSASVDVGGLVASTLNISNEDFLAGRYRFSGNGAPAAVVNSGDLRAADGGTIALLGGQVSNDGTVTARLGTAALAAGNKVTLDFAGDGLTRVTVDEAAVGAQVQNAGMVIADGGQAVLTARAAEALAGTVVNQSGVVRATSLTERDGKIVLDGGDTGQTFVSGTLDASGLQMGQKGGEIQVLGHQVGILDHASLDARGDAGGGTVLVGGDYRGGNPAVRNAQATWFGQGASIDVSAVNSGNGGKAIVWSNDATRAYGAIRANGGASSGDGGMIETSGHFLDTAGTRVSAAAPQGKPGAWLLDPIDVTIQNGALGGSSNVTASPNFTSSASPAIVTNTDIQTALNAGTNVTITTSNAVGISEPGRITIAGLTTIDTSFAGEVVLRLNAIEDIVVGDGVRISSSNGKLDLEFNSNSTGTGVGSISVGAAQFATRGGNVSLFGGGSTAGRAQGDNVTTNGILLNGTSIDTTAPGGASDGNILMRGRGGSVVLAATQLAGNGIVLAGGTTMSSGRGNITLDGLGGPGAAGGAGLEGAGIVINGAQLSSTSGAISLTGVGTNAAQNEAAGAGGPGVLMQKASATSIVSVATTSGALSIAATGGDAGFALSGPGSAGGAGFVLDGSSLQTVSGNLTINASGSAGGGGVGSSGAGTNGGTGGAGIQASTTTGSTLIQTSSGTIALTATGGTGGAGGVAGGATGGTGGAAGAGFSNLGATLLATGTGSISVASTGGAGGIGGDATITGGSAGGGGNGGAGIANSGLIQATGGVITLTGTGGDGGSGGASVTAFAGGIGGFGGAGVTFANGSATNGSGAINVAGTGGVGGPASLAAGVSEPGTEGFNGTGVVLQTGFGGNPTIGTQSGNILVFGLGTNAFTDRFANGLQLTGATLATTAGGSIDLRGRAESGSLGFINAGVDITGSTVTTSGGPGQIVISGETTAPFVGVRIQSDPDLGPTTIGGPSTTGSVVIRARNNGSDDALAIGSDNAIQTSGLVSLLPGGVSALGALTRADSDPIFVADPVFVGESSIGPFGFVLSTGELGTIRNGTAGIVIGDAGHTGPILANLGITWQDNLTLQNGGAGSAGITIAAPLNDPGNLVTLSSGGTVSQTAPITAGSLLVHGTQPQSNFQLTNAANNVGVFAARFETPKDTSNPNFGDVNYVNSGALTIGPLTGRGFDFDGTTVFPTTIAAANSTSGGDFFAQTLAGNLTLDQSIATLGSDITLVSAGLFDNAGNGTLTPGGGGRWLTYATTWVGENRGGLAPGNPQPNFYNCTFGGPCGVTIPGTGNHFVYRAQPSLTLTANDQTRPVGSPNPPLTFTPSGLVNNDTVGDAVVGGFSTTANPASGLGTYPITGSFTSPVGYILSVVSGTLIVSNLDLGGVRPEMSRDSAYESSNVYGKNFGLPGLCLASGPLSVEAGTTGGGDLLSLEWSRVRLRPNLSNCVEAEQRNTCSDF